MELGIFPCIGWSSSQLSNEEILKQFLKIRPSSRWLMLGFHVALSNNQLWTAWHCCERRHLRDNKLARSIDAEFIRYLAGTHHVSEAFSKAGLGDGDSKGWLVYLPESQDFLDNSATPQSNYLQIFENEYHQIIEDLNIEILADKPKLDISYAIKLGLEEENLNLKNLEDSFIAFILSSEFNS